MKLIHLIVFVICCCSIGCNTDIENETNNIEPKIVDIPFLNYQIVHTIPHDATLFTEGLVIQNNQLFESTGSPDNLPFTKSMIGITNLKSGKFTSKVILTDKQYFGEGITFLNNKLYQLTYLNKLGFIYDATTFKKIDSFTYANAEGWGMTTNGKELIMSDGTEMLTFIDPITMKPSKKLAVLENSYPVTKLNELEYVDGFIYANIWTTNIIVKINAITGKVEAKLNLTELNAKEKGMNANCDVLNGIAYNSLSNTFFVTGKLWKNIYELKIN
jgi:glutamine cyclotransferase